MKKFVMFLLACVLMVSGTAMFAACQKDENTLKVGVTQYVPMDYLEDGEWVGFDADLARKTFGELGYTVEFVEIDWESKIMSLDSKEIDVIWNGMTITDELRENILLSDPYMVNQQVLVIQKEDEGKYTTIADLEKVEGKIAVESGSAADTLISEMENISDDKKLGMSKQLDTFLEVKSGRSEVAVVDITLAQKIAGQGDYQDLTYVDIGFAREDFAVGFRKEDTELCKKVNELLEKYAQDGTIDELKNKYEMN